MSSDPVCNDWVGDRLADPNYGNITACTISGSIPRNFDTGIYERLYLNPAASPAPPTFARAWRERTGASPGWLCGIGVLIVGGVLGTAYGGMTLSCGCPDKQLWFRPADWAHVAHFVCATALVVWVFARCVTDD